MKFAILVLLLLNNTIYFSQNNKVDSLLHLVESNPIEDTNKVQVLYKLCFLLRETKSTDAIRYGNKALDIATRLNYKKGIAASYNNLGSVYDNIGKTKEAVAYFLKAYEIKKQLNDPKSLSSTINNLGVIFKRDLDFNKALKFYHLSLDIALKANNTEIISSVNLNIGLLFAEMALPDSAVPYLLLAKSYSKNDIKTIVAVYSALSRLYEYKKPSLSILYSDSGMSYYTHLKNKKNFDFFPMHLAQAYQNLGKLDSAAKYYNRAIALTDTSSHDKIQQLYYRLSEFNDTLYRKTHKVEYIEKALMYFKLSSKARSDVYTSEKSKLLSNIYRQIEVQDLESQVMNTKKEKQISDLQSSKQKIIIYFSFICIAIITILAAVIYKRFIIKKQLTIELENQKNLIQHQKRLVDEKQKEVMDSIHYAKNIQQALITNEKYIEKTLNRLQCNGLN